VRCRIVQPVGRAGLRRGTLLRRPQALTAGLRVAQPLHPPALAGQPWRWPPAPPGGARCSSAWPPSRPRCARPGTGWGVGLRASHLSRRPAPSGSGWDGFCTTRMPYSRCSHQCGGSWRRGRHVPAPPFLWTPGWGHDPLTKEVSEWPTEVPESQARELRIGSGSVGFAAEEGDGPAPAPG
jgi:hypothetical protein